MGHMLKQGNRDSMIKAAANAAAKGSRVGPKRGILKVQKQQQVFNEDNSTAS